MTVRACVVLNRTVVNISWQFSPKTVSYGVRRGSTPGQSTVLRNSVKFFVEKYICNNDKKKLSKLKSGQYPVWMTQKPKKGDFRELKSKTFPGKCPRIPLEACSFAARLGNRSVFLLDPRLAIYSLVKINLHFFLLSQNFQPSFEWRHRQGKAAAFMWD